jgi:hypothetical protein
VHRRDYGRRRDSIDKLRATIAAAARLGVFHLDDKLKAVDFVADGIGTSYGIDPAIGLYASYAYSEAGRNDVERIRQVMYNYLQVDLFDVALLASSRGRFSREWSLVPFCPMLTQGWNFLRAREVGLPPVLDEAQDELEPALWTTFKPSRTDAIFDAVRGGQIP